MIFSESFRGYILDEESGNPIYNVNIIDESNDEIITMFFIKRILILLPINIDTILHKIQIVSQIKVKLITNVLKLP